MIAARCCSSSLDRCSSRLTCWVASASRWDTGVRILIVPSKGLAANGAAMLMTSAATARPYALRASSGDDPARREPAAGTWVSMWSTDYLQRLCATPFACTDNQYHNLWLHRRHHRYCGVGH